MCGAKILIIEDDKELNLQLSELLASEGYQTEQCFDGETGLIKASTHQYQLILLDVMLPKRDGLSLLKILRKSCQTPVIMLTAKGAEQEKITGLSEGADDYVAKPFNITELFLRIKAMLKRSQPQQQSNELQTLSSGSLILNAKTSKVLVNQEPIEFTPVEFKLIWELLLNQGVVLSKAYLYQRVLNRSIGAYDRSLDMHLSRVRKKLNAAAGPGERLITSHGKGYSYI